MYRKAFLEILTDLSRRFINMPPEHVDSEIDDAISAVCRRFGLDMGVAWQWSKEMPQYLTITHLYRPPGGSPLPEKIDAEELFPWCMKEVKAGRTIAISVDKAPAEADRDRETWAHYGVRSTAVFPLSPGRGQLIGALSFATIKTFSWSKDIVKELQLVAEIFANALARKYSDQALRESEERLSLASTAAGIGLWILDIKTNQYWATAQALQLFELPPDYKLDLNTFINMVHPEDREKIKKAMRTASKSNDDTRVTYRVVLADGTIRWLVSRGRMQPGTAGDTDKLMGVSLDVTERMEAEVAAKKIQTTVTAILESTQDLIWTVDPERFGLITFNTALAEYFRQGTGLVITEGMSPHDMIGGSFTDATAEKWDRLYERALRHGPYTEEYVVSTGTRVLLLSLNLLKRDGEVFGISVFGKDVTERKRMEKKIEAAALEWQTTFDSIPDMVMILDAERRVIQANRAAWNFLNVPLEETLGRHCHTLMHGEDHPPADCPLARIHEVKNREERDIYDSRTEKWLHVSVDPIFDEKGESVRFVHMARDITASKKAEKDALESRRELLRMQRLFRMGELTASLAHELNQPLTSILSNARAALRFIDSGELDMNELKDILNDIANDDRRAGNIIRSLRAMVKPEDSEKIVISLSDVLHEAVSLFHSEAIIRNIDVDTFFVDPLPGVNIDVVQIQQVLTNLMMNAAESMLAEVQRKMVIRAHIVEGGKVRVTVSDCGPGIADEDLGRIFEPFFTTKRSGLGMGLSLSRSIIEAHGGHMRVENNPDRGATFSFELPLEERNDDRR